MQRFLTAVSAAALLASVATAQCFESNFGTQIGLGDDTAFPSATTATAFVMPGFLMGATTYTHFTVNTNGVVFPWTAATGVVGATATGYSTAPATQLTNLRGAAGGGPRIAPLWRDLNLLAANNGALWVNNLANKCVFTWANAVQFGTTSPIFTVQAQLFPNGDVQFFYNGTLASTAATITGISQGGGIAAVAGVDLNPGPNVSTSYLHFEQFAANAIDLANTGLSFANTGTGYAQTAGACIPATNTSYGTGCYTIPGTGNYELHADALIASGALQGNAIQYVPSGSGYTGIFLAGGATAYVAPTGGATNLFATASDDGTAILTLGTPLSTPQGPVSQISVSANGIVTLNNVGNSNGDFSPTGPEFATGAGAAFYAWHDYNEADTGSGRIKGEQVGNVLYLTWDNVDSWPTGVANTSTMQFQLDLTTGVVTTVWVTVDTNTTSTFGSQHLVGWKASGAVTDNGSIVLSTALPLTNQGETVPMALAASGLPISTPSSGSVVTYTTSSMPEFAPGAGIYVGINIVSLTGIPAPGVDLVIIGAPGCNALVGTLDIIQNMVGVTSTQAVTFPIPAGVPAGLDLFSQSAALIAPNSLPNGQNAFGLTTSNAIRSNIQQF